MRISSSTFTNNFLTETQQLEQQQNTLQGEATTGLSLTEPGQNPAVMSQVLAQQADSTVNTSYQNNITALQSAATTTGSALSSLQTIVSQVNEIATEATSGTNSSAQLSTYATQVQSLIQQALQVANTQDANGNYIFAGTATATKPFAATTDANGNVTGVTYQGNSKVTSSQIGSSLTISAQIPGENTTGTGTEGLFSDSRTGTNLFGDMISLQQNLASGNTGAISSTNAPALTKDEDNVINQVSANGVTQSALSAAGSLASINSTNFTTEISNETSVDMATTLTKLDQTQTAYEAALESGTMVMNLSLLNFLG